MPFDNSDGYIQLYRRFRDLTEREHEDSLVLAMLRDQGHELGIPWSEILQSDRVLLLAEAGSGKTREMREQVAALRLQNHAAFFVPLEALAEEDLPDVLAMEVGEKELFDAWLADGVDVTPVSHPAITRVLG
jgi:hypothetical protein